MSVGAVSRLALPHLSLVSTARVAALAAAVADEAQRDAKQFIETTFKQKQEEYTKQAGNGEAPQSNSETAA